jgi:hypothetical protein
LKKETKILKKEPLDWALDGSFEEEALAIRDAMEKDFFTREDDSTLEIKR